MTRNGTIRRVATAIGLLLAVEVTAGPALGSADGAEPTSPPAATAPDPLRSPVAPYRGRYSRQPLDPSEAQRLLNYRTDLRSRQRELEQARPHDSPRLMEESRELRQELDRLRRLTR